MTTLKSAMLVHWSRLKNSGAVKIQYRRGTSVTRLDAVPGRTTHEITTADGAIANVQTADWIVRHADLNLTPSRGQDVVELLDYFGQPAGTYVVTHPIGGEPWRWCDPYQQIMRIMTVQR